MKQLFLPFFLLAAFNIFAEDLDPINVLQAFVEVDTVNPPGNETNAVNFYAISLINMVLSLKLLKALLVEEISGQGLRVGICLL
jgi:hypothetical protein